MLLHILLIASLEALYAMGWDGIYFGCWCHHHPKDYFVASILVLTQESTMAKIKNVFFGVLVNVVEFIIRLQ